MKNILLSRKSLCMMFLVGLFLVSNIGLSPLFADKLVVPIGKSINLKMVGVKKIMAVKDGVVEVLNVANDEIILAGVGAPDTTQLIIWDNAGKQVFDVETFQENQIIQQKFQYLIGEGGVAVQLFPDSVYLRGIVDVPEKVKKAETIISKLAPGLPIINLIEVKQGVTLKQRITDAINIPTVRVTVINPKEDLTTILNPNDPSVNAGPAISTSTENIRIILEGKVKDQNEYMRMYEVVKGFVAAEKSISNLVLIENPIQVIFQAYILQVSKGKTRDLGIDWGGTDTQGGTLNQGILRYYENVSNAFRGGAAPTAGAPISKSWANPFTFNNVNRLDIVAARVQAWETQSLVKVLSNPKLTVYANSAIQESEKNKLSGSGWLSEKDPGAGDKGEGIAYVNIVNQTPYLDAPDNNGIRATKFLDAELTLAIRDLYVNDDHLKFSVYAQQDDLINRGEGSTPGVDKRKVMTTVRIQDQETVVLGGLINNSKTKSSHGVPILSKLPYIGRLFKNDSIQNNENELIILLTPKILNYDTNLAGKKKFETIPIPRRSERLEELHQLFQDIKQSHFPETKKN